MKQLVLDIPDNLNLNEREAKTFFAAKLYEKGDLTLTQAANLSGYTKSTFMELLGNYNVSIFNLSATDLENDIANAKRYHF